MNKNFIFAVATLVGAIVGLGMFGIPYTANKAGFFIGIGYLLILGVLTLLLHLIIGEIVERTKEKHRITGYIEKYLGKNWKKTIGTVVIFGIYAALLAYIIVAGEFLHIIFPDFGSPFILSLIFWFLLSLGVGLGIKTVAKTEIIMSVFLILFVFILVGVGADKVNLQSFQGFNFTYFFLPYGVILFALDGTFAIPEIREFFKSDGKKYKLAIIVGTLIPVLMYLLFTSIVVGVSRGAVSEESLSGLVDFFGSSVAKLGAVFGIFAIATSYLVLGINLKNTFKYDWHMSYPIAFIAAAIVPVVLFIGGLQRFIEIISFSGAVFGALVGICTIYVYKRAVVFGDRKPAYSLNLPKLITYGIVSLLALGGIYEIIYLIT